MLIWIFTIIVYVFFIYGVIEFIKNFYSDIFMKKNKDKYPPIQVLVEREEDLEYIFRHLKGHFSHITFVFNEESEDIQRALKSIKTEDDIGCIFLNQSREVD